MVRKGQTIIEFVVILLALTAMAGLLKFIWPSLTSVQTNAASTIGRD
jgi:hypothetical protein